MEGRKLEALNDDVLLELNKEPAKSLGGILLPTDFDKEDTDGGFIRQPIKTGKVISVGPGRATKDGRIPVTGISVGQTVVIKGGYDGVALNDLDVGSTLYVFPASAIAGVA